MKKVLAIVLALIMACSALTMAFAADTAATPAEPTTESGLIGAVKGILDTITGIFQGDGNGNYGWQKAVTREMIDALASEVEG